VAKPVEFATKLILWVSVGVGVSVVCLAWGPIGGDVTWTSAIGHGQLVLVAVTLTAGSVGYCSMVSASAGLKLLKAIVIGLGIVDLVLSIGIYASFSDPTHGSSHSPRLVATTSYVLLASSIVIGIASTYLTHRED
jgi:hypothetical protein